MDLNLLRQQKLARYLLLATVIATVVNVALLLGGGDLMIPYCASLPYYLAWLGKAFDNGLQVVGSYVGEFTRTGMLMCFVLLVVWLVVWYLSRRRLAWLKVGLGLVIADTALLLLIGLLLFGSPVSSLLELIFHGVVIWEIAKGIQAWNQLDAAAQAVPAAPAPEESAPF